MADKQNISSENIDFEDTNSKVKYIQNPQYSIKVLYVVKGIVTKNDIIGTIYRQGKEIGEEYSIETLLKKKRLGRFVIEHNIDKNEDCTRGQIIVPVLADKLDTSLIAATFQLIDRVSSYKAIFKIERVINEKEYRRYKIFTIAKEIYESILNEEIKSVEDLKNKLRSAVEKKDLIELLPNIWAGPRCNDKELFLVEGRADVSNLLKYGIKNVVSVNGLETPEELIQKLASESHIYTALFDGDRGGRTILEKLQTKLPITYQIVLAEGLKVEKLDKATLIEAIKNKKLYNEEKENN